MEIYSRILFSWFGLVVCIKWFGKFYKRYHDCATFKNKNKEDILNEFDS